MSEKGHHATFLNRTVVVVVVALVGVVVVLLDMVVVAVAVILVKVVVVIAVVVVMVAVVVSVVVVVVRPAAGRFTVSPPMPSIRFEVEVIAASLR